MIEKEVHAMAHANDIKARRFARGRPHFLTWNIGALTAIVVISFLHYKTHGDVGNIDSHALFRRLYYLPIAMLAATYGQKGGLAAAFLVIVIYIPHAFLSDTISTLGLHVHSDPASTFEKFAELILYASLGWTVGFAVDLARKTQKRLDERDKELHRAARLASLGELVAGVAHEIKNPLASLRATAEMFLDDYEHTHKKRRMVELNFEEVKRLEGIVDRFLTFAKPSAWSPQNIDLFRLMEKLRALVESTAHESEVQLVFDLAESAEVFGDADQILQTLLNIVLNALDASPLKGRVIVAAKNVDDHCLCSVDDEGEGVEAGERERIFDPFYTSRAQGSGLGLSIAARMVENHGGTIVCEKSALGGARFLIRLPRAQHNAKAQA